MKQTHPDFEPTVARVAARMAQVLLPQHLQAHADSDDSTALDEHLFGAQPATDRHDSLDDVTAINNLFAQKD